MPGDLEKDIRGAKAAMGLAGGDLTKLKDADAIVSVGGKALKGLSIACLIQACLMAFAVLFVINLFNPSDKASATETDSGGEAVAGVTVPNTVTTLGTGKEKITIPSTKGKTGVEEYLSGMTFSRQCNSTEEKWYITMRWPYVAWAWNGRAKIVSSATTATKPEYATKRIIVYNPKTKKSVVTAICEAGPAPWTGSGRGSDNPPSYWTGYHQFDPDEYATKYVGRVSGLAPAAFRAIDAKEDDVLEYGFAEDQNIALGPIK